MDYVVIINIFSYFLGVLSVIVVSLVFIWADANNPNRMTSKVLIRITRWQEEDNQSRQDLLKVLFPLSRVQFGKRDFPSEIKVLREET